MALIDFITPVHKQTKRDYLARVTEFPKADAAIKAKQWDYDYWDGDRRTGFGGYHYDGRWVPIAQALASHYQLQPGDRVLDVGCGKGFLLYDLTQIVPGLEIAGLDISTYALTHSKDEVRSALHVGTAAHLPFDDASFDLVISINTLHNLYTYELLPALQEIERVGKQKKYVCVEAYRNEIEKVNLMYWQLTCEQFCTPDEWAWWFAQAGYTGDYGFIFFE